VTPPVITIDGPAGSGKTTLGRHLARTLGLPLVDTGLFYRGVMVAAARAGIGPDDRAALIECARQTVVTIDTDPTHDDAGSAATVDGIEAGPTLRDPANAPLLASVSSIPEVRTALLDAQRRLATRGAVAVGRDCGTVVFPNAQLKLYLDATEGVRARRRASQLQHAADPDSALMRGEVGERDRLDASRSDGPMQPAPGAYRLDTGVLGIDDVVRTALDLWAGVAAAPG
jgi:cytidylate kinase